MENYLSRPSQPALVDYTDTISEDSDSVAFCFDFSKYTTLEEDDSRKQASPEADMKLNFSFSKYDILAAALGATISSIILNKGEYPFTLEEPEEI